MSSTSHFALRLGWACVVLSIGLLAGGCGRTAPTASPASTGRTPEGEPSSRAAWTGPTVFLWNSTAAKTVPGVDAGRLEVFPGPDREPVAAIWWSLAGVTEWHGKGVGGADHSHTYEAVYTRAGGGDVPYDYRATPDGRTRTVTLAGRTYDLNNGSLLLVSAAGNTPQVLQLKRDIPKLAATNSRLFAQGDKEITDFFAKQQANGSP